MIFLVHLKEDLIKEIIGGEGCPGPSGPAEAQQMAPSPSLDAVNRPAPSGSTPLPAALLPPSHTPQPWRCTPA